VFHWRVEHRAARTFPVQRIAKRRLAAFGPLLTADGLFLATLEHIVIFFHPPTLGDLSRQREVMGETLILREHFWLVHFSVRQVPCGAVCFCFSFSELDNDLCENSQAKV